MLRVHNQREEHTLADDPGRDDAFDSVSSVVTSELDSALSASPNDNYELREMVSVATTYLNQGMVDDAEELLTEALTSGYNRADAIDLRERVRRMRGVAEPLTPMPTPRPSRSPMSDVRFTTPLPGADRQSAEVQRAIRLSDADVSAGRLQSALDATLHALALAPAYFPIYVRLAELRLALDDADGATELVESIKTCVELRGADDDWLLLPIRVALDPTDTDAVVGFATHLLEHPGGMALEPHVPDAIAKVIASQPAVAFTLATDYLKARPRSDDALRLYATAAAAQEDSQRDALTAAITAHVHSGAAPDLLYLRAAVAANESRDAWLSWLERAIAGLAARPGAFETVPSAITIAETLMPTRLAGLSAAMMTLTARQLGTTLEALDRWSDAATSGARIDRAEAFLAAATRAFAAREAHHPDALELLCQAIGEGLIIDVRNFVEHTTVFGFSVAPDQLLHAFVSLANEHSAQADAITLLSRLRDRFPELPEVRGALAELQLANGAVSDGVRELRMIAERYEQAGDTPNMVAALRRIAAAMPNNAEAKSKMIEGYLQRGVLDEAVVELQRLGNLHVRRGKRTEAVAAFTRGAEVAATLGNVVLATQLYDSATTVAPDDDAIRHAAVAFHLQTGSIERAAEQLWAVVRIAVQAEDPDEAVAALHQIIALTPTDPGAYHKLGEVLSSMGEYAQAERVYRRLGQMAPHDPVLIAKQSALAALAAGS
jgi:tetratricopeptide (TPR) repeat protein